MTTTPSRARIPASLVLLGLANAVSLSGNVVMTVAVPWLVLTTTGSAALTGLVAFSAIGAAAVGGLAAGRLVDTVGPVRASAGGDLLSGLAVAPLAVLLAVDALEIWHVVALTVAGTLADSAGAAARQSLVPAVADAAGYPRERANSLFTSAEHVGYLCGAPLAGLLVAAFGSGGALAVTAAFFAVAALLVGRLVHAPRPDDVPASDDRRPGLRETFAFIWRDPALRALLVFPTLAVLLVGPLVPLVLPVLAIESFGDPVALGVMVAAYGLGGLLGAVAFGIAGPRVRRRHLYLAVFAALPGTYAVVALLPALPLTLLALLTLGAAAGALVPLQATIRQERSPAHLLPRVVGLSTASIPVAGPVGLLATGVLVDGFGLHTALMMTTVGALLLGAVVWSSDSTRHFERLTHSDHGTRQQQAGLRA